MGFFQKWFRSKRKKDEEEENSVKDKNELKKGDIVAIKKNSRDLFDDDFSNVNGVFEVKTVARDHAGVKIASPHTCSDGYPVPYYILYFVHRKSFEDLFNEKVKEHEECVRDYKQKIEYMKFMNTNRFDEDEYNIYASLKENGEDFTKEKVERLKKNLIDKKREDNCC